MAKLSNPLTEPIGSERPDYSDVGKKKVETNKSARMKADPELLRSIQDDLAYDDGSGRVLWVRNPARGRRKAGTPAGHDTKSGYRMVKYQGALFMESHVVWVLTHGSWPVGMVKPRDGDPQNTKVENLRLDSESDRESGLPAGVVVTDNGQFKAFIYRKTNHYLGIFNTPQEAHEQYLKAKALVHNRANWAVEPQELLRGLMLDYKNRAKPE